MRPLARTSYLVVVVLIAASILTSVQVAQAHYDPPPGCWMTSHVHDCRRCGLLWLYKYDRDTVKWKCPDGSSGIHQVKGSCGTCQY